MKDNDIFEYASQLQDGALHIKSCSKTGLKAIIAIDSTRLGPALGGTRCLAYPSLEAATHDAIRLAKGMTYKAATLKLPLGGGKAIIWQQSAITDRKKFFQEYGRFIEELGGKYITATDSGTAPQDMDEVAKTTRHVTCTTTLKDFGATDPSPYTARTTLLGMQAAVAFKHGQDHLKGLHIAIQGVGNVGYKLAQMCFEQGAQLTICDTNEYNLNRACQNLRANVVSPEKIYNTHCDIYAPCALGGILNTNNIKKLKTSIVAGCANNQLLNDLHAEQLKGKNILYAPDYIINAGGLIYAAAQYFKWKPTLIEEKIQSIGQTLKEIFTQAEQENNSSETIAKRMALEHLNHAQNNRPF